MHATTVVGYVTGAGMWHGDCLVSALVRAGELPAETEQWDAHRALGLYSNDHESLTVLFASSEGVDEDVCVHCLEPLVW